MAKFPGMTACCTWLFLAAFANAAVAASDTLRCGNRLVSVGDNKAEVLIKCGSPAWKDAWTDQVIDNVNTANALRVSTERERWVYNFGHNSFLRYLLFENGRLVKITTGDYGYDSGHPSAGRCDIGDIHKGASQYEVLQRCGEPAFKDTRQEERLTVVDKNTNRLTITRVDEWTYNFGPTKFLRILRFENGELVDVETGDRGF
ncbi:MAG: DUF2845 domain-containing protein [Gammaproteobacteria bacterium]